MMIQTPNLRRRSVAELQGFGLGDVTHGSEVVSIDAPSVVAPGEGFRAVVTMRNTGTKPWGPSFELGSESPRGNTRWGTHRAYPGPGAEPGDEASFAIQAIAPDEPGDYPFDWRMLERHVRWFGPTASANITVEGVEDSNGSGGPSSDDGDGEEAAGPEDPEWRQGIVDDTSQQVASMLAQQYAQSAQQSAQNGAAGGAYGGGIPTSALLVGGALLALLLVSR